MFITGIGKTKFGVSESPLHEMAYEAAAQALHDADMTPKDLQAVYVSNFVGGPDARQLHLNAVLVSLLQCEGIPAFRTEAACAAGGSAVFQAIRSPYDNILVVGAEKMTTTSAKQNSMHIGFAGDRLLDQKEGLIFPASYALIAQQHMMTYGTTLDDLAAVSLKNHVNSQRNPLAHFAHKKVTLEDIRKSPIVCSPLRLFDCSPISDGAAAVVLTKKKKGNSISIAASAMATDSISLVQRKNLTSFQATKRASENAYKEAGVQAKDLDVMEVHDCFTIAELVAMEDLGVCAPGESGKWVREGKTALNGELPINPDGGLKADGHPIGATGIAQLVELAAQLRGEAGKRQVKNAETGLAQNVGGVGGTAAVHILKKG
ncbi:thiolase domain-containing protein [Candidatus Micrarchaeota archaeon]|nr:thiolase domain-containing protein [Candidatus Micrarchaeota archaeon]